MLEAWEWVERSQAAYAATEGTGIPMRVKLGNAAVLHGGHGEKATKAFERGEESRPKLEPMRRLSEALRVRAW